MPEGPHLCMQMTKLKHAKIKHAEARSKPIEESNETCQHRTSTISATPAMQNDGGCKFVPRLPRETKVDVTKCHACHAKCRGVPGDKSGPSAPPSAICPTPATPNDGGCEFVPRPPRESKVDVTKCHACHAKCRGVPGAQAGPSAPPSAICPTPAMQNDGGCKFVPRLPRETRVNVTKCHACHAKCRGVPGAQAGPSAPPSDPVPSVPRLPRQTTVDASSCHACHVNRRWMSPSATPATQSAAASRAPKPDQARHPVPSVPRLPRKTTVDASLCHACHVKRGWMSPSATPATQSAAASRAPKPDQARHPVPSVPRLPRKRTVDVEFVRRLTRETRVDVTKCHACHAKCRGVPGAQAGPSAPPSTMSAMPATQKDGGC